MEVCQSIAIIMYMVQEPDGERLIPEYKGKTPDDYPGNNNEYSIVGYNYDVRG